MNKLMPVEQIKKIWEADGCKEREILLFSQRLGNLIRVSPGTGDNLDDEDIANGFNDYLYFEMYEYDGTNELFEVDGGMWTFNNEDINPFANPQMILDITNEFMRLGVHDLVYLIY